jgi:general secretion pathway protein C
MSYVNPLNLQRLSAAVNLGLLTLGAYMGVGLFYQMVAVYIEKPQATAQIVAQSSARESGAASKPVNHYNPIMDRDLFKIGKAAAPAKKPEIDPDTLAKTQLNLKLWGTVSGDTDRVYAVIEDLQKREQNLYRVGDTIQNATVKIVMREKVVLNVEGRDEVLAMEEMAEGGSSSAMIASKGRSPRTPQPMAEPQPTGGDADQQNITLQRSMVEESFNDMNKLMTEIAITPNMEDGQPNGLSLNRISPNSIFRRMGLRNGDVLMGVNGEPIQSPEDAMRMYNSIKSSNEVQVQVKRRGQDRTIIYNLQ